MNEIIQKCQNALSGHLEAIQGPLPEFAMRHLVIGQHDTPAQQWAHAVLEMEQRLFSIAESDIDVDIIDLRIDKLRARGTPIALRKANKLELGKARVKLARRGAIHDLTGLLKIKCDLEAQHCGRGWTREELDADLPEYWRLRSQRQMIADLNHQGRVSVGNQELLRQLGMPVDPPEMHIASVERRFIEHANTKILIAVPTLIPKDEIRKDGLKCLDGWSLPGTLQQRQFVIDGRPVDAAYNEAARAALNDGSDFLLCVEDDHVIPQGTFEKLWSTYQQHGPRCIVGAWYPQKKEPRTGASIVLRDGKRDYLDDGDGQVHDVYAVTQGFTLIPVAAFRDIPQPWFVTTGCVTQDSFFSQLAREAGYKLLVDTSAKIKHVCRETEKVYE